jgi:hypothetical protein
MLKTKSYGVILVVALSAILGTGIVLADDIIGICIAPATLNLNAGVQECDDVIVHADIPYAEVNESCDTLVLMKSVVVDDVVVMVEIATDPACCADDCGNLVARFNQKDVVEDVEVGEVYALTLTGKTNGGTTFTTGTDTIRVINSGKTQ